MLKKILKIIAVLLLISLIVGGAAGYYLYQQIYVPNISEQKKEYELFIPTGAKFQQVVDSLSKNKILKKTSSFEWVAQQMNYENKIFPGRYIIKRGWNNRELVNLLRSGEQTPLNLTINNIRTKEQLVSLVGQKLEADSVKFAQFLNDSTALAAINFTPENVISVFVSDTYEFWWNTNEKQFFDRMLKEYNKFWTEKRVAQAKERNLTPFEAITLAAIVEEETLKTDEMPRVAGVYLNRLRKEWPLQADPTVKFAVGDFTLRRILKKHLEIESPYNTYLNVGLPPGPIRIPMKKAIEAVLDSETHKYMFFCAKEDFSGYHNFAVTLREHNINARKYQRELNRRKIK